MSQSRGGLLRGGWMRVVLVFQGESKYHFYGDFDISHRA